MNMSPRWGEELWREPEAINMSLLRSEERISLLPGSLIPVWLRLCCAASLR
jgi:hypothetical protein